MDEYLSVETLAARLGLDRATIWRQVAQRRLPSPVYVASRSPRWRWSEIEATLEQTRALPREAQARRRRAAAAAD